MASAQEKQYYATLAARSGLLVRFCRPLGVHILVILTPHLIPPRSTLCIQEGSLSASDVYTPPELQTPLHQIVGPYWQCRSGVCVKRYPTKDALLDHFLAEHAHSTCLVVGQGGDILQKISPPPPKKPPLIFAATGTDARATASGPLCPSTR